MPFWKITQTISALAVSACLPGCHGQPKASRDEFRKVLQRYYDRHPSASHCRFRCRWRSMLVGLNPCARNWRRWRRRG